MLCTKPNDVFKFVKFMRKERDIEGGGCMKENDGRLVVRDGHFRIPNPEGSESHTIWNSFCGINWVIGFDFIDKSVFFLQTVIIHHA